MILSGCQLDLTKLKTIGETMNLTFGQVNNFKQTLIKLLHTTAITDFNEIIAISRLEEPLDKTIKLSEKASNAVISKYSRLAEARKNQLYPQGSNTSEEIEDAKKEQDELWEKIIPSISFDFPVLKKESIDAMFKDEDKSKKLTAYDLSVLAKLGMMPKKEGK